MTSQRRSAFTRRELIASAAFGSAGLLLAKHIRPVSAQESLAAIADTPSVLIDVSRCTGCHACSEACKLVNHELQIMDPPTRLGAGTLTFVDEREVVGPAGEQSVRYVKRQCMHCLTPACASACPAGAMHRSAEGPVLYRADRCLGCRYCQIACPFGVPQFDWDNGLTPQITKCWMCASRLSAGELPACVEGCPTGALRFGARSSMLYSAHARIRSNPGRYIDRVYGEHELGGTSMLYLSDVPFGELGLPADLPTTAPAEQTDRVMTRLPATVGGLTIALSGAAIASRHRESTDAGDKED